MDAIEANLLAQSHISGGSGHPNHKGFPRETFIKEFLAGHLSERVSIGTGEIIDSNSRPGQSRNQLDIVLSKKDYPRIDFGGNINGFLSESVVATIEVKSNLDQAGFETAMATARNLKTLNRTSVVTSFSCGYQPPSILTFLVAYDGPKNMQTIYQWVKPFMTKHDILTPNIDSKLGSRQKVIAPCLDGIFILGKGFMIYGNSPISLVSEAVLEANPAIRWTVSRDCQRGSLLMLFLILTQAAAGNTGSWWNPIPYVSSYQWPCEFLP